MRKSLTERISSNPKAVNLERLSDLTKFVPSILHDARHWTLPLFVIHPFESGSSSKGFLVGRFVQIIGQNGRRLGPQCRILCRLGVVPVQHPLAVAAPVLRAVRYFVWGFCWLGLSISICHTFIDSAVNAIVAYQRPNDEIEQEEEQWPAFDAYR